MDLIHYGSKRSELHGSQLIEDDSLTIFTQIAAQIPNAAQSTVSSSPGQKSN